MPSPRLSNAQLRRPDWMHRSTAATGGCTKVYHHETDTVSEYRNGSEYIREGDIFRENSAAELGL